MRSKVNLRVLEIIPILTDAEKARRIERFYDVLASVNKVPNYIGCKYDATTNTIIEYVSS